MIVYQKMTGKYFHNGTEITAEEYDVILNEIREKAAYVRALCRGEITIENVPAEWRDEIRRRADEMAQAAQEEPDIGADEALDIILGGE